MEVLSRTGQLRLQDIVAERRLQDATWTTSQSRHVMDPLVVVADDKVVQRRRGGPHFKRTWWTEESIGTASGLWLQTGADGELLLPIVLSSTGGSKCYVSKSLVCHRNWCTTITTTTQCSFRSSQLGTSDRNIFRLQYGNV